FQSEDTRMATKKAILTGLFIIAGYLSVRILSNGGPFGIGPAFRYCQHAADLEQLVDPARLGLPAENGVASMLGKLTSEVLIIQHVVQMALHVFAVMGNQVILAGGKQLFAVVPGSANERNATGHGLERSNGGNAL